MFKEYEILVENKLSKEQRSINVYHHATRSAHIISDNSSLTLPFREDTLDDYLHISVVRGPGNLKKGAFIDLPSWLDFSFEFEGKVKLLHTYSHGRIKLKVPPGPPSWQLKVILTDHTHAQQSLDKIVIHD